MRVFFLVFILSICINAAERIVVIARNDFPVERVDKQTLKAIFLKKRRYLDGKRLIPINLPPTHSLRLRFESEIIRLTPRRLERYWNKEHYRGHRPPYRVESVRAVLRMVANVSGAVGYVPENLVDTRRFKILFTIDPS